MVSMLQVLTTVSSRREQLMEYVIFSVLQLGKRSVVSVVNQFISLTSRQFGCGGGRECSGEYLFAIMAVCQKATVPINAAGDHIM